MSEHHTYRDRKRTGCLKVILALIALFCTISAGQAATVDFSGDPTSGFAPLTVQFHDGSTGTNLTWYWDFNNDGVVDSNHKDPQHTYTTAGNYTVNLTVYEEGVYGDTKTKINYIQVDPLASFTGTPTIGNAPLNVQFTDTSTGFPNNWSWEFNEDGVVDSNLQNPNYLFTIAGRYSINLTVRGNDFRQNTTNVTDYITVRPLNSFTSNYTTAPTPYAPLAVQFNDTSTGSPTEWFWDFGGDGTSPVQNATHVFNTAGIYSVSLVAQGGGVNGTPPATQAISVYPKAEFTGTPQSGVYPLTVAFTDQSTGSPVSWLWDFGDGTTSTLQNPTHIYSSIGVYTVSLTVTGADSLSDTETKTGYIFVNTPARPLRANINGRTTFFSVDRIAGSSPFNATFYPYPVRLQKETTYTWDFGDGTPLVSVGTSPGTLFWVPAPINHVYSAKGLYSVTLTVKNSPTDYYSITIPNYVVVR